MRVLKSIFLLIAFFCTAHLVLASGSGIIPYNGNTYKIPLSGNAFITRPVSNGTEEISDYGLINWTSSQAVVSTYFKVSTSGMLNINVIAKVFFDKSSTIKVTVNGVSHKIFMKGTTFNTYSAGSFYVPAGYVKVDLQGVSKNGLYFGRVSDLQIDGPATSGNTIFCNNPDYYYWARRGPSCHLGYVVPTSENVSYYYNEVTVPVGQDNIGSYFMVNGFGEGYFGMQVNTAQERRVLFSVWSPFETDDPTSIPDDKKIKLNCKGENVTIGEFGNEGSGGQSYLVFPWKAGLTYKFLLKANPDGVGNTDYTAWFFNPEAGCWMLIASWKRPYISTYLKGFYSFVENFEAENGYLGRKAEFGNQWVRTEQGKWIPISKANFTADNTSSTNQRVDASGGTANNKFFLRNGGFTNEYTPANSLLSVTAPAQAPNIDLSALPYCNNTGAVQQRSVAAPGNTDNIKLLPNPTHSFIQVKGLDGKQTSYSILNVQGKILKTGHTNGEEISVSTLPDGIYMLNIYDGTTIRKSLKFIKS
ncbi:hypothetical protein J2795_002786 [Chryseobacterium bernardetii]|uniref:Uncharacterized protein n=2 Tax=Chryseobacterium TaxID=59732 RepID=A0ACC6IWJ6_9FLAO|nr:MULTISPECIES: DUF3472 domain-containing protein [Chryseobacterium]MDR6371427.1 hypothetical protein [Chryseobacterium vietnamense]MDR6442068.1 hypothetical protein [Chryseobacterium bernardetii]TQM18946.1 putative secreted protein (Por secretion system target) [Chryseobacterium aquifrigidense]